MVASADSRKNTRDTNLDMTHSEETWPVAVEYHTCSQQKISGCGMAWGKEEGRQEARREKEEKRCACITCFLAHRRIERREQLETP